jgi:YesN/AraC family two-component response regulator
LIGARVIENAKFTEGKQTDGVLYQKVISYLSEHYAENITLSSVAKTFGYNEKYLSHTLHTLTQMHFSHLLSLYRIQAAKRLLEGGEYKNITEIATACGFSALNTFHRTFKETVGITPSEYRRDFKK